MSDETRGKQQTRCKLSVHFLSLSLFFVKKVCEKQQRYQLLGRKHHKIMEQVGSPSNTWSELEAAQLLSPYLICRRRPDVSLVLLLLCAVEFIAADTPML